MYFFRKSAFEPLKTTVFYKCSRYRSTLNLWHENINTDIKHKIEKHWAKDVMKKTKHSGKRVYVLPMFPYPSGNLHMGHVRVYSISDTIARFNKLNENEVIHPIGWDAFGLPAENAAIERNIQPHSWTTSNIKTMREQLLQLGFDFDWDREFSTCDPKYYKWTQYIFLKLFEKGLAYQSRAKVNWDPIDKTVLADEQVDDNGCSWRSGAKVEKMTLTQWYIKTTKYAKSLYDGLNNSKLENWRDIINLQRHWIGECDGVAVDMYLKFEKTSKIINVWTADPYKFIYGEYLVISPENVTLDEFAKDDIGSLKCYNPVSGAEMPIHISNEISFPEGREMYIACPSVDEEDREISKCLNIPLKNTTNIDIESENKKALEMTLEKEFGYPVSSKLKDWLISRQRYWGTPIPIIHCPTCGAVPVPIDDLPVELPNQSLSDSKSLTLSNFENWVKCRCPKCSGDAKRETDTMDTFVDSSWYFYRFLDPFNENQPFDYNKVVGYAPVTCYIGGKEHAVLHLYYARFMSYFLNSIGLSPSKEPFKKLIVQGMVMGQSYKTKASGKYLPLDQVEKVGKEYKEKGTGELVVAQWEKMSKSKHNGENPQRLIETYGCDTTRLLILADVPPATSRKWSDATLPGVINWQHRLWLTVREFLDHRNNKLYEASNLTEEKFKEFESSLANSRNYFIATTTYHFKYTHQLSVGISRLQSLTSALRNKIPADVIAKSKEYELALASLIIMLSPVTPHFCSELWAGFTSAPNKVGDSNIDWNNGVLDQKWPTVDLNYPLSFQCKVDGADRCDLKIEASKLPHLTEEKALQVVLQEKSVQERLKHGILRTKYELYPDCRAILHIYTNRTTENKVKKNVKN